MDKIIYDKGTADVNELDFDLNHLSEPVKWGDIPGDSKDENHVILTIETSYHSMYLGKVPLARLVEYFYVYDRLHDNILDETYGFPEYYTIPPTKTDSLGFDITDIEKVTVHFDEENSVQIKDLNSILHACSELSSRTGEHTSWRYTG